VRRVVRCRKGGKFPDNVCMADERRHLI
jgi:hypothetical protein